MQLARLTYLQHESGPNEWRVEDCAFGSINLMVGKNASGKTRILNVVKGLANLVSGDEKLHYSSGDYQVVFSQRDGETSYTLKYENSAVLREELTVANNLRLERGPGGRGRIYAEKEGDFLDFQTPEGELACVNRRDSLQHSFFEPLYQWGKALRYYPFGTQLGKDHFAVFIKGEKDSEPDLKDPNCVVPLFKKAARLFQSEFEPAVRADMAAIGYDLKTISLAAPKSVMLPPIVGGSPQCLVVKEGDLRGETDQHDMSQGMFRALSLLIHLDFAERMSTPSCILVDDIGEGLDYERASALIKLVMEKAKRSSVQLIMSTNDRFVMNNVPLEYWSVVKRVQNGCRILNYQNSRDAFERFEMSGLANFDFFAGGYFDKAETTR